MLGFSPSPFSLFAVCIFPRSLFLSDFSVGTDSHNALHCVAVLASAYLFVYSGTSKGVKSDEKKKQIMIGSYMFFVCMFVI